MELIVKVKLRNYPGLKILRSEMEKIQKIMTKKKAKIPKYMIMKRMN